ncbi:MAG: alpha/beta hydrolase family esterase [Candidatus Limnocylindrales bacterium]
MESNLPPGRHLIPMVHDGLDRPYMLQVPPGAAASGAALPLVLELHGRGIDPGRFDQMTGFGKLADEAGFVLAMPAALDEIWNDGRGAGPPEVLRPDDVGYLSAVLDDVAGRVPIDERRVYVVGMSNGAAMTGRLVCERADRFAGAGQVAGTIGAEIAARFHPARPVPILNIAGSADRVAPYEGGVRRGLLSRAMIRHAAGPSLGVDEWAQLWVDANGAQDGPATTTLPPDTAIRTWHGPTPSPDVVFYRIEGAGHTWPGSRFTLPAFLFGRTTRTFDGATVIWEFFAAHAGPAAGNRRTG